ncbi:hypothetical protein [Occultella kanbiaonis]|uniref:hypothetical protein n=1 Tax=Occultella kanbiaonis TaxID=2675754 RepID=UPI0012B73C16|nr:hypothetical protein [Occultella kanbiaonis]
MFIDRDRDAGDLPAPRGVDEVARSFAVPLLTLVEQDSIEEASVGEQVETHGSTDDQQHAVLESA